MATNSGGGQAWARNTPQPVGRSNLIIADNHKHFIGVSILKLVLCLVSSLSDVHKIKTTC
jgi:hypothetical protein